MNFMDIFKLVLGVLVAGVIGLGAAHFAGMTNPEPTLATAAYAIAGGEEDAGGAKEEKVEKSVMALLAEASADRGKKVSKKCAACHTFEEGGKAKVGPNLWNIVNRAKASVDGFAYTENLVAMGAAGEVWSYENLDKMLTDPKAYIPGTKMSFAGLKKAEDRAAMIAYLRSMSNDPAPLPSAEAPAAEEAAAAPVEEAAPAAEEAAPAAEEAAPAAAQ